MVFKELCSKYNTEWMHKLDSFLQINFNEEYQQSKPDQPDRLHAGVWEGSIAGKL